jgi:hypothetical protein
MCEKDDTPMNKRALIRTINGVIFNKKRPRTARKAFTMVELISKTMKINSIAVSNNECKLLMCFHQ